MLRLCTLPIEFVLLLRLRRALSVRLSVVPTAQRCALLNSLAVGVGKRCAPLIVPCSPAITLRTCKVVSPGVLWIVSRTLSLASSLRVAVLIGGTIGRISLSLLESSPTRTSFNTFMLAKDCTDADTTEILKRCITYERQQGHKHFERAYPDHPSKPAKAAHKVTASAVPSARAFDQHQTSFSGDEAQSTTSSHHTSPLEPPPSVSKSEPRVITRSPKVSRLLQYSSCSHGFGFSSACLHRRCHSSSTGTGQLQHRLWSCPGHRIRGTCCAHWCVAPSRVDSQRSAYHR